MPVIRKQKDRKKQIQYIVLAVAAVLVAVLVISGIVLMGEGNTVEKKEVTSSEETIKMAETVLPEKTGNLAEVPLGEEYYISEIFVAPGQNTDDYVNVRIRFPNGEDYIVMKKKKVSKQVENGFYMYLEERDVHMLSSAITDVSVYEGTKLYLSSYAEERQEDIEYPWNTYVMSTYGVSEGDMAKVYERRILLEENLLQFMNQLLQKN